MTTPKLIYVRWSLISRLCNEPGGSDKTFPRLIKLSLGNEDADGSAKCSGLVVTQQRRDIKFRTPSRTGKRQSRS